jgi:SAM-dependent methyltransferase
MARFLRRMEAASKLFGVDPRRSIGSVGSLARFYAQHRAFQKQADPEVGPFAKGKLYPCFGDDSGDAGAANGHYFHQDLLVAQKIYQRSPRRHVDVGSRIDGFVSHLAAFREVEVFDIRPLRTSARSIRFTQRDAMNPSTFPPDYADSVSCLHALEHFGLGRYGDPLNYGGHLLGWKSLVRLLEPGGTLYLSVPIGSQRVEFNAQRVFSIEYLLSLGSSSGLTPAGFSYIDDQGEVHIDVTLDAGLITRNADCNFGCGIFEFKKPRARV